jgi:hypothetical protein
MKFLPWSLLDFVEMLMGKHSMSRQDGKAAAGRNLQNGNGSSEWLPSRHCSGFDAATIRCQMGSRA